MNTGKLLDQARNLNTNLMNAWYDATYYKRDDNRAWRLSQLVKKAERRISRRWALKQQSI